MLSDGRENVENVAELDKKGRGAYLEVMARGTFSLAEGRAYLME